MRQMHVRKQYIVPLAALVISLGIVLANLLASEPLTAEEIVAKSMEHFEGIDSYQLDSYSYSAATGDPFPNLPMQLVRPDNVLLLTCPLKRVHLKDQILDVLKGGRNAKKRT